VVDGVGGAVLHGFDWSCYTTVLPELNTEFYKNIHIQRVMGVREILSTTFGASCDIGLGGLFADVGRDCDACAKASATIYSLMLTCRACGVDPHDWLAHALAELPQHGPEADIEDLFPFNFVAKDPPPDQNTT